MNPKQIENFMSKITKTDNCWIWSGSKDQWGYGLVNIDFKTKRAHRISYQLFKGDIPKGLTLDHLCRNRACVNPEHLEAVTNRTNIQRGNSGKYQKSITHCPKGHEYTDENTRVYKNKRTCRKCRVIYDKENYQNKKLQSILKETK